MISRELTERTERLRETHLNLVHAKYRSTKELSIWDDDSCRLESVVVRKARALELLLRETPAIIMDDELIVGLRTLYNPLDENENVFGSNYMLPVKPATKHMKVYYPRYLTEKEASIAHEVGIREGAFTSHVPFGTQKVLSMGYRGIQEEACRRLEEIQEQTPERTDKIDFLRAVIIVLQAASDFALKHSYEAERIASETNDLGRRAELNKIADICRWVSSEPPRSFHEALQLFWFTCIVMAAENQSCIPIGRFDQDLYPYLERDLDIGVLTREWAQELLECLWIKLNFEDDLTTDTCRNIMLSGQKSDGGDATNELTYMCLDASLHLRITDPKINVRFHERSPEELWLKCCDMVKAGLGGFPVFYNDEAIIPCLLRVGVPIEDARLYSCDGCQEIIVPGKGDFYPVFTAVNLLECVLRTIGVPPYLHDEQPSSAFFKQAAPQLETFEEFMEEYERTLNTAVAEAVELGDKRDAALAEFSPVPFLSSTLDGCIENSMDKTAGGTIYNFTGCNGQCFASAVNSLAVVKKLVYDDKYISLEELREVLRANWEGKERLRQLAINRAPKFGNDNDYVDSIAVGVAKLFIDEVLKYRNPRGGPYYPGIFTFHHVTKGLSINASPDGRRASDPVSQHLSPAAGTDKSGPTLAINSALKVCRLRPPEGAAFDLRFHPFAIRGKKGTTNLMNFIKAFMEQGGLVIQFNVVDSKTLREAQRYPERYRSLIVRVWGFSAYFVTLTKEYQDEIIARTVHGV